MRQISSNPTHDHIFKVAAKLFSEKGYYATSVREIAKEADVSLSLVNYHFGSKKQLLIEIIENGRELIQGIFAEKKTEDLENTLEHFYHVRDSDAAVFAITRVFMRLFMDNLLQLEDVNYDMEAGSSVVYIIQQAVKAKFHKDVPERESFLVAMYIFDKLILSSMILPENTSYIEKLPYKNSFPAEKNVFLATTLDLATRLIDNLKQKYK